MPRRTAHIHTHPLLRDCKTGFIAVSTSYAVVTVIDSNMELLWLNYKRSI